MTEFDDHFLVDKSYFSAIAPQRGSVAQISLRSSFPFP